MLCRIVIRMRSSRRNGALNNFVRLPSQYTSTQTENRRVILKQNKKYNNNLIWKILRLCTIYIT